MDCVQATDPDNNSIAATMAIWENFEDNVSLQTSSIFVHVELREACLYQPTLIALPVSP